MLAYSNYVRLCEEKGYTPSAAAKAAGVSKSTISKWKANPNSLPTSRTIAKLARFLGVSISELLCEPEIENEKGEKKEPTIVVDSELGQSLLRAIDSASDPASAVMGWFSALSKEQMDQVIASIVGPNHKQNT